ncbi:glycosyltransferase [Tardiphaga sp.]|uniref:glycosyltransferase n=1 Tax=Tardiphaga sp. TaxID=1926292 RepID=UPI00262A1476|nr:glycosyltransferase [Tardiphaga sp.]MDB5619399.1 glycosyl transferase, group 1 [Tardiphaga sp.]
MAKPRVLFVCHTGAISGAELVLVDLVQPWAGESALLFENGPLAPALAAKGLKVTVSRWGQGLTQVRRDSSILKVIPLVGRLFGIVLETIAAARRHDVVYANSQKAFVLSALAVSVARRPLIWHLHDIISSVHFGAMQRRVQVTLANLFASRVVVPSKACADAFIAEGGKQPLVVVVPNGLDIAPEALSPAQIRQQLQLPEGPLVGVFSRLAAWKGQHVVLQALARTPGVSCIIAGDAMFGEQAYAAKLNQMVIDLDLGDRVHFLGRRSDVPRLMRAVDAVVHPSIDPEPFGRTLVEAMLAGVPVIATDAGAASDILQAGRAGTLVPPGDADALAAAIINIMSKPPELAAQLNYAEARAKSHYGAAQMLRAIAGVIDDASGARA